MVCVREGAALGGVDLIWIARCGGRCEFEMGLRDTRVDYGFGVDLGKTRPLTYQSPRSPELEVNAYSH